MGTSNGAIKLNVANTLANEAKGLAEKAQTELYQASAKPELLGGFSKTYQANTEDGEQLKPENKKVLIRAEEALTKLVNGWVEYFDASLTRDNGDTLGKADIVVDGVKLAENVPISTLLWMEKRLTEIGTLINSLPVLPETEDWNWDAASSLFTTKEERVARTFKKEDWRVVVQATKEHPAQAVKVTEDVVTGYWTTVKRSGAFQRDRVEMFKQRFNKLRAAVATAKGEANSLKVPPIKAGREIYNYLFPPTR